ncbi:MAG: NusG domain II-containing protein [Clostridia bacterium]|nr:NusG domain II-containing protein [Clostridia bacterium]
MTKKWISRADVIVLAVLLLVGLGLWILPRVLPQGNALVAEVTVGGETVLELDLQTATDRKTYTLENGVVLVTENHTVAFLSADCPDKVCVNTGALSHAGEVAACVPTGTVVTVKGESRTSLDGITY